MNNIILIGRLTKDPEIKTFNQDKQVAKFTIAVQRDYKGSDGQYPTDFINCSAFGHTATYLSKYIKKGQMVAVNGKLYISKYQDAAGNNRYSHDVNVDRVQGFSTGQNTDNTNTTDNTESGFVNVTDNDFEGLPFA